MALNGRQVIWWVTVINDERPTELVMTIDSDMRRRCSPADRARPRISVAEQRGANFSRVSTRGDSANIYSTQINCSIAQDFPVCSI
ncbi:hypothetical protein Tcan_01992 [Toxocara canis]|uniref:Uncharacterized protein n=1 Tax=Toxocara canis TaxID=6265 RepID=A0A0B2VDX1_TOXCA|nr:hypothetical protein Tcan_01992 [Toxocara canis]